MNRNRSEGRFAGTEARPWHRALEAGSGSLFTYVLWRIVYQAHMRLPYPAELSFSLELAWGGLIGRGFGGGYGRHY